MIHLPPIIRVHSNRLIVAIAMDPVVPYIMAPAVPADIILDGTVATPIVVRVRPPPVPVPTLQLPVLVVASPVALVLIIIVVVATGSTSVSS